MRKLTEHNQSGTLRTSTFTLRIDFWIRIALFSIFWILLTGWQPSSWGVGVVFIVMASSLSFFLTDKQQQTETWRINPTKSISFLFYFFVQSLRGGWDIAKLALIPQSKLSPGVITYHTDLVNESHIFTLMQVLSLLPGTVSAKYQGSEITIHVLNLNSFDRTEIDDCQLRVSELLGSRAALLGGRVDS
ncbi:MAG: multicomponent Na+:H+ antiporter subunit E [Neolewinella sp.]|jgi:multicomponent Na+:H+ antiporter subunit E